MKYAIAFVFFAFGCSAPPDDSGPRQIEVVSGEDAQRVEVSDLDAPPGLKLERVFFDCEWGCPPGPYWVHVRELPGADVSDAGATLDAEVAEGAPGSCAGAWTFSACCGDGICQREESAFFCPADC